MLSSFLHLFYCPLNQIVFIYSSGGCGDRKGKMIGGEIEKGESDVRVGERESERGRREGEGKGMDE